VDSVRIWRIGDHPTIVLAAEELAGYLARMTGAACPVAPRPRYEPGEPGIWVGEAADLTGVSLPAVNDPRWDDAIAVDVAAGRGVVAGNSPRSVLLAVYRYLTALGCRWVRPGADGEYIPAVDLAKQPVKVADAPAYRHRALCIEGAVSLEHVRDIIAWAPKLGFNGYFMQFDDGYPFFQRWYEHELNPLRSAEPFTAERSRALTAEVVAEVNRRSLAFHDVGHGWTCGSLGVEGKGWEPYGSPPAPEIVPHLALLDGKRTWFGGCPLNTNLCYSNPATRRLVVENLASFALARPDVDVIHLWLADAANNQCECDACRQMRPADWYVLLLNEVDALLTEKGIATRIVFLAYVDLLWPPEKERLRNPGRFILMFAPITRSYTESFADMGPLPALPPYRRNQAQFAAGVEENVAFLRGWQQVFAGDSFDFDYHYWQAQVFDPAGIRLARVLHGDIRSLRALGLNGYMSCQTQRSFWPMGLGLAVMGQTLWDPGTPWPALATDYFAAAFGAEAQSCYEYLDGLGQLFDPAFRGDRNAGVLAGLDKVSDLVDEFAPVIARNRQSRVQCWAASWGYLVHHAEVCKGLARALAARARGDGKAMARHWQATKEYLWAHEEEIAPALDVWLMVLTLDKFFVVEELRIRVQP
jgi:hypothetical protein